MAIRIAREVCPIYTKILKRILDIIFDTQLKFVVYSYHKFVHLK
jgi:hypothetical protein